MHQLVLVRRGDVRTFYGHLEKEHPRRLERPKDEESVDRARRLSSADIFLERQVCREKGDFDPAEDNERRPNVHDVQRCCRCYHRNVGKDGVKRHGRKELSAERGQDYPQLQAAGWVIGPFAEVNGRQPGETDERVLEEEEEREVLPRDTVLFPSLRGRQFNPREGELFERQKAAELKDVVRQFPVAVLRCNFLWIWRSGNAGRAFPRKFDGEPVLVNIKRSRTKHVSVPITKGNDCNGMLFIADRKEVMWVQKRQERAMCMGEMIGRCVGDAEKRKAFMQCWYASSCPRRAKQRQQITSQRSDRHIPFNSCQVKLVI